jgi:hypothetical protein
LLAKEPQRHKDTETNESQFGEWAAEGLMILHIVLASRHWT